MIDAEQQSRQPSRPRARWLSLLWGQLAVTISMLLFFGLTGIDAMSRPWIDGTFFSLLVWLCEVLGFWLGLGSGIRRIAVIAVLAPLPGCLGGVAARGELIEFQVFTLGIFAVVAITTALLRWWRGALRVVDEPETVRDGLQFGIQHVMIWTGILALLFGVSRYLVQTGFVSGRVGDLPEILLLAATMSACAVASVWALLSVTIHPMRLLTMAVVIASATAITHWVSHWWIFAVATLASQVLLSLTLLILRQSGYRFVRSQG
jgi:hypothetical protein